jgi:hypothetical protein
MNVNTAHNETASSEIDHHDDRPSYDDINVGVVVLIGFISMVATVVTFAFVEGLTYHWQDKLQMETSYEIVDTPSKNEIDRQKASLNYNAENGAISIDTAIQQIAKEYGQEGGNDPAATDQDQSTETGDSR